MGLRSAPAKFAGSFLLGLCLGVCSGLNALALTNSVPADGPEYESVAFVSFDAYDPETDGKSTGFCNAAVLSPELLITAAHCIRDAIAMGSYSTHVEIGKYIYVKRPDGKIVRVGYGPYLRADMGARFFVLPSVLSQIQSDGYSAQILPEDDLAAVVLEKPLALGAGFEFAKTASQTELAELSASPESFFPRVVSVNLSANQSTLDTKRVASLDRMDFSTFFSSVSSSRVEEGDSGAPLSFKTASGWVIAGVVKGRGQLGSSNWDAFAPLGQAACDIADELPDPESRLLLCH